jgi:hypothetical protein
VNFIDFHLISSDFYCCSILFIYSCMISHHSLKIFILSSLIFSDLIASIVLHRFLLVFIEFHAIFMDF